MSYQFAYFWCFVSSFFVILLLLLALLVFSIAHQVLFTFYVGVFLYLFHCLFLPFCVPSVFNLVALCCFDFSSLISSLILSCICLCFSFFTNVFYALIWLLSLHALISVLFRLLLPSTTKDSLTNNVPFDQLNHTQHAADIMILPPFLLLQHHEDAGGGADGQVASAVVVQPGPVHEHGPDQRCQGAGLALPLGPLLHLPGRRLRLRRPQTPRARLPQRQAAAGLEPFEVYGEDGGFLRGRIDQRLQVFGRPRHSLQLLFHEDRSQKK